MTRLNVMSPTVTIQHRQFDAAIFDLDGVLTDTASLHAAAWKVVFDEFLQKWAERQRIAFDPFDPVGDYLAYDDGRRRKLIDRVLADFDHLLDKTTHD